MKWQDALDPFGIQSAIMIRALRAAALALAGVVVLGSGTAVAAPCGALLCVRAAAGARGACAAQARDDFIVAKSLCQEHDPVCVTACAARREECRNAIGFVRALEACDDQLRQATAKCLVRHPPRSVRRALCLDRAQLANVRCQARVWRETRRERRRCDRDLVVCVTACGPGSPPGGAVLCRAHAARTLKDALAVCAADARATRDACLDKDATCVQDCRDARDTCAAPAVATLASAIVACDAEEQSDVTACAADPPCTQAAESKGFACRDAARTAAAPVLTACAAAYRQCDRDCPAPASPAPATLGAPRGRERSACTLASLEVTR